LFISPGITPGFRSQSRRRPRRWPSGRRASSLRHEGMGHAVPWTRCPRGDLLRA
jgi:hypothetical protein